MVGKLRVRGQGFRPDELEAVQKARDLLWGAWVQPFGCLAVDLVYAGGDGAVDLPVPDAAGNDVADGQVAARRERLPEGGDDAGRVVLIGDEVQDG